MYDVDKVRQLFNHPVMNLFDTRMSGTSTEMVSHHIPELELPATTNHGFSAMTGITDPVTHLRPEYRILNSSRYVL
jgi:hypothetical protein